MKRLMLVTLIASVFTLTLVADVQPATAATYTFGAVPLSDVYAAADRYKPADLTRNEFVAMILAPTWPETQGPNGTAAPSPMTMGRADISDRLYAFSQSNSSNPYKRVFWHTGVGMWQLDSAGLGAWMAASERIDSYASAHVVASEIARLWNSASGTKAQRRAKAWAPWYGCSGGTCEAIFNSIYNASTDKLSVNTDTSVTRYGGAVWKTCSWTSGGATFSCLYVDPSAAQGSTGGWRYTPYEGAYYSDGTAKAPSPLTTPMLVVPTATIEYRFWLKEFPNTPLVDIQAKRTMGKNARDDLTWWQHRGICYEGDCN